MGISTGPIPSLQTRIQEIAYEVAEELLVSAQQIVACYGLALEAKLLLLK